MRLLVRLALVASALITFLIWYGVTRTLDHDINYNDSEADETVRILLMSDQSGSSIQQMTTPQITFNVAIVLVVSLLSVALLITGIIVVAVTLDPTLNTTESDDEDEELDDARFSPTNSSLWNHGMSSPSGRLLPHFDTLNKQAVSPNPPEV